MNRLSGSFHSPLACERIPCILASLLFLPVLYAGTGALATAAPEKKPNIVFIMADDLGYAHLGCYGQRKILTPRIDRMAAEGLRFTQCYAGAPVCAPSRSVLMTGLHSGHTSVRGNSGGIPLLDDDVTVAELLKPLGYSTGIFGKWGLGDAGTPGVPTRQGFDEFFGYLHQVHAHFYYPFFLWHNEQKFLLPGNDGGKQEQYTHDVIVDRALEFVRRNRERRFFLYMPFTIPHTELLVPEDSFGEYEGKFQEPRPYVDRRRHYADQPAPRTAFAAMVTRMDRDVGRVLDLLGELGIDRQTIVFFTSDNGGQGGGGPDLKFFQGNAPLRGAKGQLHEGGIRVPMIVRWPGVVESGAVSDHVWSFQDVMPTLVELGGGTTPPRTDGISAVPSLVGETVAGRKQERHRHLYWEHPRGRGLMQAVRMGRWKALRAGWAAPIELYDLEKDIGETTDVAREHGGVVRTIETYLKTARTQPRKYKREAPTYGYAREKTGYVSAPPTGVAGATDSSTVWKRWEGEFHAVGRSEPSTEVLVEFVSPSGKRRTIPGFWDGGDTWRVRVMPDQPGMWEYRTRSRPAVTGLDRQTGRFRCDPALSGNRFAKHGAVRVASSGPFLEHRDGTPFFWLGDTVWNGPILASDADWDLYLKDRVAKKFSVVQYNALAPWRTAPKDEVGQVAFTGRKDVRINPKYFQRLDRRIDAVNSAGLLAAHVLIWSLSRADPGNYLPEADVIRLVKYQIARYGAHHVVWILAGDNPYRGKLVERWKRIGRAVFGGGPHAPVTTHPTGTNWPWEEWRDEKWLDVLGYQSGHGDDGKALAWIHSGPVKKNWSHHGNRPIINLEPPYEDHIAYQSRRPHSAHNVRRAVYWSLLCAPTAGVTYGGHGMWSWQTVEGPPRDHERSGVARVWNVAKDLPGAFDIQRMAELFNSLRWWTLRPADDLLASQPGREDPSRFVAAALSTEGTLAILYLPVGGEITLVKSPTDLRLDSASWFDPRTGRVQKAEPRGGRRFTAPDSNDWVLVLKRRSR